MAGRKRAQKRAALLEPWQLADYRGAGSGSDCAAANGRETLERKCAVQTASGNCVHARRKTGGSTERTRRSSATRPPRCGSALPTGAVLQRSEENECRTGRVCASGGTTKSGGRRSKQNDRGAGRVCASGGTTK